jgi:hypothetical protein
LLASAGETEVWWKQPSRKPALDKKAGTKVEIDFWAINTKHHSNVHRFCTLDQTVPLAHSLGQYSKTRFDHLVCRTNIIHHRPELAKVSP